MGREGEEDETGKKALRGISDALCNFDASSLNVKSRERERERNQSIIHFSDHIHHLSSLPKWG